MMTARKFDAHDGAPLVDDYAQAIASIDREASSGAGVVGLAVEEVIEAFMAEQLIAESRLACVFPVNISSELLKKLARKHLWRVAAGGPDASRPSGAAISNAGQVLATLAERGVFPARVRASVVGGVGITVPLMFGYVYIEAKDPEMGNSGNVVAKRVYHNTAAPEIRFLDDFDGSVEALANWAADVACDE